MRERVGTSHQQSLLARRRAEKAACLAWAATLRVALTNRHQESAIWTSPLVTVVVTHFNRAAMLRQAVHSVYEQVSGRQVSERERRDWPMRRRLARRALPGGVRSEATQARSEGVAFNIL